MRSPGGTSIVLKAGRQKKIWLVGVSTLFIVLGLALVSFAPESAMGILAFIGFSLAIVILGGISRHLQRLPHNSDQLLHQWRNPSPENDSLGPTWGRLGR